MDNKVIEVPLSMLRVNPWQPRNVETHIVPESIVESIRKHGLLQIPVGRMVKNGAGDLVQIGDGWQRWRAYVKLAEEDAGKYSRLPVMIREHYHQTDKYSQRGDSARKAMVMLLGEQKANEIDSTFAPDLKKPAKKAAAA